MKALALILMLLVVGDVAVDHGAVVLMVGHAGGVFAHGCAQAFTESMFAT